MSLTAIRAAAATIIREVSAVGPVYEYQRWTNTWEKFLELFKDANNKINGCMITRTRTPEDESGGSGQNVRKHELKIVCVYGLKDEDQSEIFFQDSIVDGICSALRAKRTLNGTVRYCSAPSVETVGHRMFGKVLCHYAEIIISAEEMEKRKA